jgi:hypothetical protein
MSMSLDEAMTALEGIQKKYHPSAGHHTVGNSKERLKEIQDDILTVSELKTDILRACLCSATGSGFEMEQALRSFQAADFIQTLLLREHMYGSLKAWIKAGEGMLPELPGWMV